MVGVATRPPGTGFLVYSGMGMDPAWVGPGTCMQQCTRICKQHSFARQSTASFLSGKLCYVQINCVHRLLLDGLSVFTSVPGAGVCCYGVPSMVVDNLPL